MAKVVLAYSGGLDTSVAIHWLKEKKSLGVIAFSANLGQAENLEALGERAIAAGAESAHAADLREEFIRNYVFPALKANAFYHGGYLLATALGRPLIAAELVKVARENDCEYVAHGCTGKGNDQVRFDTSIAALAPELKVVAPLREWDMRSREEEIDYAKKHSIKVEIKKKSPYSLDRNLWGMSIECGALEDPWQEPPEDAYFMTKSPEEAPVTPTYVEVTFDKGVPVALDGEDMQSLALIERLNAVGGENGVGRVDSIEDRLVGIKSREIYEAPAAMILFTAHRALEALTIGRDLLQFKEQLSQKYGQLVYNGLWFSEFRKALDAFFDYTQKYVSGTVRMKLFKGNCVAVGRKSPHSLYEKKLATYTEEDVFDHRAAVGFIKIFSGPLALEARRNAK
jgi:argininosuccinate synthase